MSFSVIFGDGPKFVRALYKVAYSALAYFEGPEAALAPQCDAVRAFVRDGDGAFAAMMADAGNQNAIAIDPPRRKPDYPCLVIVLSIFGVAFLLDLASGQEGLRELVAAAPGAASWGRTGRCCRPDGPGNLQRRPDQAGVRRKAPSATGPASRTASRIPRRSGTGRGPDSA